MTNGIKFTAATVEEVARRVERLTKGHFALESVGRDLGEGVRYFDGHSQRVWRGSKGARQACAYYIGGALGMAAATGSLIPDGDTAYLMRVQAAYMEGPQSHKRDMENWEASGRERAGLLVEGSI